MLHIVNKSPTEKASLQRALLVAVPGDVILLIEDGVYAAVRGSRSEGEIATASGVSVYALAPDIQARGLGSLLIEGIRLVDYGGFVDLVVNHPPCQSWL